MKIAYTWLFWVETQASMWAQTRSYSFFSFSQPSWGRSGSQVRFSVGEGNQDLVTKCTLGRHFSVGKGVRVHILRHPQDTLLLHPPTCCSAHLVLPPPVNLTPLPGPRSHFPHGSQIHPATKLEPQFPSQCIHILSPHDSFSSPPFPLYSILFVSLYPLPPPLLSVLSPPHLPPHSSHMRT